MTNNDNALEINIGKVIIFHRVDGWYPTEYPVDYSDWQAEADRNPGTIRIENWNGDILWQLDSTL